MTRLQGVFRRCFDYVLLAHHLLFASNLLINREPKRKHENNVHNIGVTLAKERVLCIIDNI